MTPTRTIRFRECAVIVGLTIYGILIVCTCGWLLSLIVTGRTPARWHTDPAVIPAKVIQYSFGIASGLLSIARAHLYRRDKIASSTGS